MALFGKKVFIPWYAGRKKGRGSRPTPASNAGVLPSFGGVKAAKAACGADLDPCGPKFGRL